MFTAVELEAPASQGHCGVRRGSHHERVPCGAAPQLRLAACWPQMTSLLLHFLVVRSGAKGQARTQACVRPLGDVPMLRTTPSKWHISQSAATN